jgi:hypothetical protein
MLFWNKKGNKPSFLLFTDGITIMQSKNLNYLSLEFLFSSWHTNGCSVVLRVGSLQDVLHVAVTLGLVYNLSGEPTAIFSLY